MPKQVVIDSNILIKSLREEDGSEKCQELIRGWISDGTLILVPSLFEFEVYAVLCARGDSCDFAQEIIEQWKGNVLRVVELKPEYIAKAQEIVKSGNNRSGFPSFYDSIYHAISIIEGATFFTADHKHVKKAEGFGFIQFV